MTIVSAKQNTKIIESGQKIKDSVRIVDYLQRNGTGTIVDFINALGISKATASGRISELASEGTVWEKGDQEVFGNKYTVYEIVPVHKRQFQKLQRQKKRLYQQCKTQILHYNDIMTPEHIDCCKRVIKNYEKMQKA